MFRSFLSDVCGRIVQERQQGWVPAMSYLQTCLRGHVWHTAARIYELLRDTLFSSRIPRVRDNTDCVQHFRRNSRLVND